MGLTVFIQFRGHTLHLHLIGDFCLGPLIADAVAVFSDEFPGRQCQHRHDQHNGDEVDDIQLSDAFCFLFHDFLRNGLGPIFPW